MAEGLLARRLRGYDPEVDVASAGISALVGYPADPASSQLMQERGTDISSHAARQLTSNMIQDYELILVMEKWQIRAVHSISPIACGKTHLLGRWTGMEVADPYGGSRTAFEQALGLIDESVETWMARLWK